MKHFLRRIILMAVVVAGLTNQVGFGAESEQIDVILGNNGSVVKGKIIGRVEGKYITVQMENGQQITIRFTQIAEIMKGDANYEARHRQILDSLKQHRSESQSVVKTIVHADLNIGADDTSSAIGLTGVVALLTRKGVSVGFGAGWDQHEDNRFLPVFGELGYYFTDGNWRPYLRLQGGYSLGWRRNLNKSDFGGFRLQFGIGLQRAMSEQLSLAVQFNYNKQSAGAEIWGWVPQFEWISGSLGIAF